MKLKQATPTIKVNIGTILDPEARGMRVRTTTLLAWLFWLLVLVFATASFVLRIQINSLLLQRERIEGTEYLQQTLYYVIFVPALAPTYGTVGPIIASRRPANAVGGLSRDVGLVISCQDAPGQVATPALALTRAATP